MPNYRCREQTRRGDWPTRVHAAHALGPARREVQARATHRSWNHVRLGIEAARLGYRADRLTDLRRDLADREG
ncbi:hypothetical protein [Micromonospora echinospora]|uniref:hypothetical protein n=1 Tax=Micromonospora echinospora TaxID=1877 RepID=UPI00367064FA